MIGIIFDHESDITSEVLNTSSIRVLDTSTPVKDIKNSYLQKNNLSCIIRIKSGERLILPISFNPSKSSYICIKSNDWIDKKQRLISHTIHHGECQNIQIDSKNHDHPFLNEEQENLILAFRNKDYSYFQKESQNILKKEGINKNNIMLLFYNAIISGLINSDHNMGLSFVRQGIQYKNDFSEFYTIAGDIYLKNNKFDLAISAYEMALEKFKLRNMRDIFPCSQKRSYEYSKNQIELIRTKYGNVKKIVTLHPDD